MEYEIVQLTLVDDRYEQVIRPILDDAELMAQIWADAETRMEEASEKQWFVAVSTPGDQALAWCAARLELQNGQLTMVCEANYERRGIGRAKGLYAAVFEERQQYLEHLGLPCVTYIFDQPLQLHLDAGWLPSGAEGISSEEGVEPHHWQELRYGPRPKLLLTQIFS